ncbi:MAG: GDP-L-fucose synthase [Bacteroidota bacterium]
MEKNSKIYVAGHTGLVGSAILRSLKAQGYSKFLLHTIEELDLTRQSTVEDLFKQEHPEYVILAAAKVGGIHANNTYPADFIYINLQLESNIIHSAYQYGVKKLCFLGSSCIYPKFAQQPMKEDYLLDGKLESTNEPYAVAKIAGIKMCQAYNRQYGTNFISVMPTNLYGPHDNFDLQSSHVLPALIRKFVDARKISASSVTVWGTGAPKREFLFVDDLADACVYLMNHYDDGEIVNIGTGKDISILELANMIKEEVGFYGTIEFDATKPDGTPRKLLDVSRINALGWTAKTPLREGIRKTIQWYLENR